MNYICVTCLSTNRRLLPIKYHQNLLLDLVKVELNAEEDRICWECEGVLKKLLRFKERALRAQQLLKCIHRTNQQHPTSLSSLANTHTIQVTSISTIDDADSEHPLLFFPGTRSSDNDVRVSCQKSTRAPDTEIIVPKQEYVDVGIFESDSHGGDAFETTSTKTECENEDIRDSEAELPAESFSRPVTDQRVKVKDMKRYKLRTLSHTEMVEAREKERYLPAYTKNKFNCDLCVSIYRNGEQLEKHNVKHSEQQHPTSLSSLANTHTIQVTSISTIDDADSEHPLLFFPGTRSSDNDVRVSCQKSIRAPDTEIIVPKQECVDVGIFESDSHGGDAFETTSTKTECENEDVRDSEAELLAEGYSRPVTDQRVKVKDMKKYKLRTLSHAEMVEAREKDRYLPAYTKNKFNCDLCVLIYRNGEQLEKHNVKHSEQRGCMVCSVCQCRFPNRATLQRHRLQHYQIYECYHCDYSNTRMQNMIDHCNRAHRDPEALFKCPRCKEMFGSSSLLRKHRLSVHSERVPCEKCERSFTSKQSLKRHVTLLHNKAGETYECAECGKRYRSRHGIRLHLYSHSPPAAAAYCAPCNVQYSTVNAYRKHLHTSNRHVADEDKRYQCKDCGKRFSMKEYLRCHNVAVHLKKPDHECSVCKKMFVTASGVRRHKLCVHEKRPRPKNYICDICAKAYLSKAALVQHMHIHSGARPYCCAQCPANFAYSGALHTHVKLVHLRLRRGDSLAAKIACGRDTKAELAVT